MFKSIFLLIFITGSMAHHNCTEKDTLLALKRPVYEFSVRLLDRLAYGVSEHFVYSPLSTWLQLALLAEGAQAQTLSEIWQVTGLRGYRRKICFRRKLKEILNKMEDDPEMDAERKTLIVVDKFYKVKKAFKSEVESLHSAKVLSLDFDDPEKSIELANENTDVKEAIIVPDSFDKRVLLISDVANFKSAWKFPFNKAQTKLLPFYSEDSTLETGRVRMMNQIGYFKQAIIPLIDARVIELPCSDDRASMLIFLPIEGSISKIFYLLQKTTLTGVLNSIKIEQPIATNLTLPKFKIDTEVENVAELVYDMGVKRAFYPELANLKGITDSGVINVSLMTQAASIEVTESHVTATASQIPENLIFEEAIDFNANKPFAFMLVDKETELILFAGLYSKPNKGLEHYD